MKTCEIPTPAKPNATAGRLEKRGMFWVIGAFVFCPCHLPITLSAVSYTHLTLPTTSRV